MGNFSSEPQIKMEILSADSEIYWLCVFVSELNKFSPDLKHLFYSSESQLGHHHHRGWNISLHTRVMAPATVLRHLQGSRTSAPGLTPGKAEPSRAQAWLCRDGDFEIMWSLLCASPLSPQSRWRTSHMATMGHSRLVLHLI